MKKEVLLFAEDIIVDKKPLVNSDQSQVFTGVCTQTGHKIVIKQIDILNNPDALIKELQIQSLFTYNLNNDCSKTQT